MRAKTGIKDYRKQKVEGSGSETVARLRQLRRELSHLVMQEYEAFRNEVENNYAKSLPKAAAMRKIVSRKGV